MRFWVYAALCFLPASVGCEWQDFPVYLYVDSSFSDLEVEAILDAADEWNQKAGTLLADPGPLIVYAGRITDEFDRHDYGDDTHVIYRVSEPDTIAEFLAADNDGAINGNASLGDVTMFMYRTDDYLSSMSRWRSEEWLREYRYRFVRNLALHEFGHLLGIAHYNNVLGTMNTRGPRVSDERGYRYLNENDLAAFCAIYDCR